ncbi:MAG: nicotinate (nicotinamide) nucleotide adenylyltransferase [Gemmatimonadales bacterium]|nr:nicotinate (nicotinamide) nucleotide adenylyltransferase [Candidatus Palauibacter irciniicola]MYC19823.1 nicotinate (nicotinamide) nucleotide adenylyltransferase [Gemmatimonadales bacterium]
MSDPSAEVPAGGRRTGILGGSFDPPHVGHVSVAGELIEALQLDRLLVIPARDPPHREVTLPADVRLDLTRRAFADVPGIEVSPMEIERAGPSYTVDTLEALARRFPTDRLVLAMGADQFASIHRWERWRRLPELARIAVMPRDGRDPAPSPESLPIEYVVASVTRVDISASRIRQRLEEGHSVHLLVPETIRHDVERAWAVRRARHVTQ